MSYTVVYDNRIEWQNYPNVTTPLDEINLNKMDYALYEHDRTLENWDVSKANQSDMLLAVKNIVYNEDNGQITITYFNGNTTVIDTDIEKIAVNFDYDDDPTSAHYQSLIITLDDGDPPTIKYVDLSALITQYEFVDTSTIHFTIGNDGSISANVIDGSITESKLQPNFLADCREQKTLAQTARQGAEAAETNAQSSKEDAEAWAVGKRNGVDVDSSDPTYHNNSKYWSDQATGSGTGDMTRAVYDSDNAVANAGGIKSFIQSLGLAWSTITGKPFSTIGGGLTVFRDELEADVQSVSVADVNPMDDMNFTYQAIRINGLAEEIKGTMYTQATRTLSTTTDTVYTFTSSLITANSVIDVYTSIYGINPSDVVTANGSCTVTFPKQSTAQSMTCRIYVK